MLYRHFLFFFLFAFSMVFSSLSQAQEACEELIKLTDSNLSRDQINGHIDVRGYSIGDYTTIPGEKKIVALASKRDGHRDTSYSYLMQIDFNDPENITSDWKNKRIDYPNTLSSSKKERRSDLVGLPGSKVAYIGGNWDTTKAREVRIQDLNSWDSPVSVYTFPEPRIGDFSNFQIDLLQVNNKDYLYIGIGYPGGGSSTFIPDKSTLVDLANSKYPYQQNLHLLTPKSTLPDGSTVHEVKGNIIHKDLKENSCIVGTTYPGSRKKIAVLTTGEMVHINRNNNIVVTDILNDCANSTIVSTSEISTDTNDDVTNQTIKSVQKTTDGNFVFLVNTETKNNAPGYNNLWYCMRN
ncbi:MAG: hypothetical protein KDK51_03645 [Deltaproteobacteria bacterium]|nr:hypothetical protein [Deltaproteobacteria bacterium]